MLRKWGIVLLLVILAVLGAVGWQWHEKSEIQRIELFEREEAFQACQPQQEECWAHYFKDVEKAARWAPDNITILHMHVVMQLKGAVEEVNAARVEAQQAAQENSNSWLAQYRAGLLTPKKMNGLVYYQKAIALDPARCWPHLKMIEIIRQPPSGVRRSDIERDYGTAASHLEKFRDLCPDQPEHLPKLALAIFESPQELSYFVPDDMRERLEQHAFPRNLKMYDLALAAVWDIETKIKSPEEAAQNLEEDIQRLQAKLAGENAPLYIKDLIALGLQRQGNKKGYLKTTREISELPDTRCSLGVPYAIKWYWESRGSKPKQPEELTDQEAFDYYNFLNERIVACPENFELSVFHMLPLIVRVHDQLTEPDFIRWTTHYHNLWNATQRFREMGDQWSSPIIFAELWLRKGFRVHERRFVEWFRSFETHRKEWATSSRRIGWLSESSEEKQKEWKVKKAIETVHVTSVMARTRQKINPVRPELLDGLAEDVAVVWQHRNEWGANDALRAYYAARAAGAPSFFDRQVFLHLAHKFQPDPGSVRYDPRLREELEVVGNLQQVVTKTTWTGSHQGYEAYVRLRDFENVEEGAWMQLEQPIPVPPFRFLSMNGGRVLASQDHAGRHVVLDFWGEYCGPCRAELKPSLEVYARLKNQGTRLIFVSVNVDPTQNQSKALQYLQDSGSPFPPYWGLEYFRFLREDLVIGKGVKDGIPQSLLIRIDESGTFLTHTKYGFNSEVTLNPEGWITKQVAFYSQFK